MSDHAELMLGWKSGRWKSGRWKLTLLKWLSDFVSW